MICRRKSRSRLSLRSRLLLQRLFQPPRMVTPIKQLCLSTHLMDSETLYCTSSNVSGRVKSRIAAGLPTSHSLLTFDCTSSARPWNDPCYEGGVDSTWCNDMQEGARGWLWFIDCRPEGWPIWISWRPLRPMSHLQVRCRTIFGQQANECRESRPLNVRRRWQHERAAEAEETKAKRSPRKAAKKAKD